MATRRYLALERDASLRPVMVVGGTTVRLRSSGRRDSEGRTVLTNGMRVRW